MGLVCLGCSEGHGCGRRKAREEAEEVVHAVFFLLDRKSVV